MSTKIKPYLYITDESGFHPQLQIVGWSAKSFQFHWEPKFEYERMGRKFVGAHVRRYDSIEHFETEQSNLVGRQKKWVVFFGVEVVESAEVTDYLGQIEALKVDVARLAERERFLVAAFDAAPPDAAESVNGGFVDESSIQTHQAFTGDSGFDVPLGDVTPAHFPLGEWHGTGDFVVHPSAPAQTPAEPPTVGSSIAEPVVTAAALDVPPPPASADASEPGFDSTPGRSNRRPRPR